MNAIEKKVKIFAISVLSGKDKVLTLGWAGEAAFTHDGCNWLKRKFKVGETATRHTAAEIWGRTCAAERAEVYFNMA